MGVFCFFSRAFGLFPLMKLGWKKKGVVGDEEWMGKTLEKNGNFNLGLCGGFFPPCRLLPHDCSFSISSLPSGFTAFGKIAIGGLLHSLYFFFYILHLCLRTRWLVS